MGIGKVLLGTGLALLLGGASSAQATTITLGSCFTGSCGDLPSDYEIRLVLTDATYDFGYGDVSVVRIEVIPTTATGAGDLSSLYLSFVGSVAAGPWSGPADALVRFPRRDGTRAGFVYDLELDFHPPGGKGSSFLSAGESATFTIAGLNVAAFGGAIAHVQRIGPNGEGSAHVTARVPDSVSSVTVFVLGLVALGLFRRRLGR
jgi:hypothetical protein